MIAASSATCACADIVAAHNDRRMAVLDTILNLISIYLSNLIYLRVGSIFIIRIRAGDGMNHPQVLLQIIDHPCPKCLRRLRFAFGSKRVAFAVHMDPVNRRSEMRKKWHVFYPKMCDSTS